MTEAEVRQSASNPAANEPHAFTLARETNGQQMAYWEWVWNSSSVSENEKSLRWPSTKGCKWQRVNSRCWIMEWEQIVFMGFMFFVSHKQCPILPVIFNFSHSCFHVQGRRERSIWTDFRLRFSALGLKWASSFSLQNGDMCLQSFVIAAPSRPLSQRWLCFHAEWKWLH